MLGAYYYDCDTIAETQLIIGENKSNSLLSRLLETALGFEDMTHFILLICFLCHKIVLLTVMCIVA